MDKNAVWKWLILAALVAFSLVVVMPPLDVKEVNEDGQEVVVKPGKIRFGLDLRGGSSFSVAIDRERLATQLMDRAEGELTPEALEAKVRETLKDADARAVEVLRNRIDGLGVNEAMVTVGQNHRINILLPGASAADQARAEKLIKSAAYLEFRLVHQNSHEKTRSLMAEDNAPPGYRVVTLGQNDYYRRTPEFMRLMSEDGDAYQRTLSRFGRPDPGYEFMLWRNERDGQTLYSPYFVRRRAEMTGQNLSSAEVEYDQLNRAQVKLSFNPRGATEFKKVTTKYGPRGSMNRDAETGRVLAIVLDGTLYSAPRIKVAITDGNAVIEGNFSQSEASLLRNILNAGSLPAPVKIEEKRSVAPTLGTDSIRSGVFAIAAGAIAVVIFMLIYYTYCGLIANLALLLDMILLPAGMILAAGFLSIFAKDVTNAGSRITLPVLTLPGIAGILLTIGMAVDANVLIFERIREESRSGKRLLNAVLAGYDRAFWTIMDANITTLITGVILFIFGSGPIRGFAVTLCAGIMVSMFTALVATKLFFMATISETSEKKFKMLSIIKAGTKIDFVGFRKIAGTISVSVIVVTWILMLARGLPAPEKVVGVDFTGGTSVTFSVDKETQPDIGDIRATVESTGVKSPQIQIQNELDGSGRYLIVKSGLLELQTGADEDGEPVMTPVSAIVDEALTKAFPEAGLVNLSEERVGPAVGRELQKDAILSIILALLGIIAYVTIRFEFGFALGAIAALAHDVFFTVGIYVLFGRQISLPIVAALLTIVGYSVNDTIVVFDRIREDLKIEQHKTFLEICNLSINQTLSRTVLTSLTTLLAVVMLLVFGGGAINDFALALFIGILVGTYSSIFVATPVVLLFYRYKKPRFAK